MTVRLATLADIPAMLEYAQIAYSHSNYNGLPYNAVITRRTFKGAMLDKDSRTWISTQGNRVVGLLIGQVGPHPWSAAMCATDLVFVAKAGGAGLLRAFMAWCKARKVARIDMGVSQGDPSGRIDRLYQKVGMTRTGGMYYWQENMK